MEPSINQSRVEKVAKDSFPRWTCWPFLFGRSVGELHALARLAYMVIVHSYRTINEIVNYSTNYYLFLCVARFVNGEPNISVTVFGFPPFRSSVNNRPGMSEQ